MPAPSLLPFVKAADSFPDYISQGAAYPAAHPETGERYVPFHLCPADWEHKLTPLGLLRPVVVQELEAFEAETTMGAYRFVREGGEVQCVTFTDAVVQAGTDSMNQAIATAAWTWRRAGKFKNELDGWRDELYAIYCDPASSGFKPADKPWGNAAFACERAACAIFGFATFGVHMTAYEWHGAEMKIWVPRRSPTKATWPGMLDNTVAGGIPAGLTPAETMVKECDEEASLPEAFVESRLKNVGAATYFYITKGGYLQPEVEYLYDLELPAPDSADYVLPKPHDDEVESFELMSVDQVKHCLANGEFKPNCGLILVDFLVRHGLVTPETERNYVQLGWHMRRRIGVGVPA